MSEHASRASEIVKKWLSEANLPNWWEIVAGEGEQFQMAADFEGGFLSFTVSSVRVCFPCLAARPRLVCTDGIASHLHLIFITLQ